MASRSKLFLVAIIIVTVGLGGFFFTQPAKAQGCSISSFSMNPVDPYDLGVHVQLHGQTDCGTSKFTFDGKNKAEGSGQDRWETMKTEELGTGTHEICFLGRGDGGWENADKRCRTIYVEGSRGEPEGSENDGTCWINSFNVTPNAGPAGTNFRFSGQGQCNGNARASRFSVNGSAFGESGVNTNAKDWSSSGKSTGSYEICFLITAGSWSDSAKSCVSIQVNQASQPSHGVSTGSTSGNDFTGGNGNDTNESNNTNPSAGETNNNSSSGGSNNNQSSDESSDGGSDATLQSPSMQWYLGTNSRPSGHSVKAIYDDIRVRTGPGTSYEHVGFLVDNDYYSVLQTRNGWVKIQGSKGQGWVSLSVVEEYSGSGSNRSTNSSSSSSSNSCRSNFGFTASGSAQVVTEPAYASNVRSNPGISNTLLFQVQPGESFDIIDGPRCADSFVWWQIHHSNQTGWMVEGTSSEAWIERFSTSSGNTTNSDIPQLIDSGPLGSISLYEDGTMRARIDYRVLITYDQSGSDLRVRTITLKYLVDPIASARIFCWAAVTADLQDSNGNSLRGSDWYDWSGWLLFVSSDEEASLNLTPFQSIGAKGIVDVGINFSCERLISKQQIAEDSGSVLPPEYSLPEFVRVKIEVP